MHEQRLAKLADGFLALPVVGACGERGVFDVLRRKGALAAAELAALTTADSAHFLVALRLLETLGWLDVDPSGDYRLTERAKPEMFAPRDLATIVNLPFERCSHQPGESEQLVDWLRQSLHHGQARIEADPRDDDGPDCGNRTTPRCISETAAGGTPPYQAVACYPIQMIGVGLDEAALEIASKALDRVPHLLVRSHDDDPARLVADLTSVGLENSNGSLRWAIVFPGSERSVGEARGLSVRQQQKEAGCDALARRATSLVQTPGGARILALVSDHGAEAESDPTCGVLIVYRQADTVAEPATRDIAAIIERCMRQVMPAQGFLYARDRSLKDLGLDSVGMMELKALLSTELKVMLEPTLFFRYPTPQALCDWLTEHSGMSQQTDRTAIAIARPPSSEPRANARADRPGRDGLSLSGSGAECRSILENALRPSRRHHGIACGPLERRRVLFARFHVARKDEHAVGRIHRGD